MQSSSFYKKKTSFAWLAPVVWTNSAILHVVLKFENFDTTWHIRPKPISAFSFFFFLFSLRFIESMILPRLLTIRSLYVTVGGSTSFKKYIAVQVFHFVCKHWVKNELQSLLSNYSEMRCWSSSAPLSPCQRFNRAKQFCFHFDAHIRNKPTTFIYLSAQTRNANDIQRNQWDIMTFWKIKVNWSSAYVPPHFHSLRIYSLAYSASMYNASVCNRPLHIQ